MAADPPDSYTLACEQYLHWREQGLSNREMLDAVGLSGPLDADTEGTVRVLAYAHRRLIERRAA